MLEAVRLDIRLVLVLVLGRGVLRLSLQVGHVDTCVREAGVVDLEGSGTDIKSDICPFFCRHIYGWSPNSPH